MSLEKFLRDNNTQENMEIIAEILSDRGKFERNILQYYCEPIMEKYIKVRYKRVVLKLLG
ncbi:MAG: hypothetical protein MR025_01670 [Helicobacter trogontum]|uniref:hypothetical protein n=1 Tax=Helicobacter trogontum TaxID=50960 RepID=UPI00243320F8|nr:hypothetical protein [Helicobacter trogontum]MCI5786150.1 hypothetical protein [Helicobacter trogontum]